MSNFLSVSVTGFILANVCGTESPKAFKKVKSKKMHKLLWESQRWQSRLRHVTDAGLFGVFPPMFVTLTGFYTQESEFYSVWFT